MAKSYRIKVYLDTTEVDSGVRRTQQRVDDAAKATSKMADATADAVKRVVAASASGDQARAASAGKVNQQIIDGLKKAAQAQSVTLEQLKTSARQATDSILSSLGRQAVGLSQLQLSGIKLQDTLTKGAEKSSKAQEAALLKTMVGVEKLQLSGIKLQDSITKGAERSSKAQEAALLKTMVGIEKVQLSGIKLQDTLTKAAETSSKAQEAALLKTMVPLEKLQFSGIKLQDNLAKASDKSNKAQQEALLKTLVSVEKLQLSGIKLQDNLIKEAERGAEERKRIADREAKAVESAALGPLGRLAAAKRRALTEEQIQSAARNRMIDAENRKRVDAAAKAMSAERESFSSAIAGASGLTQALTVAGAAMLAMDVGKTVVGTIVDNFKLAEKSAYDAGQMVQEYRKSLLELAALKDRIGNTTGALGEDIAFRAKTLQTAADARAFQGAALGVGESAIDKAGNPKLISQDEFNKAMEYGGAFQATEGGSAKTHGTLIGLIPQLLGRRTSGAEVAQKEAQLYQIFKPGGPEFDSLTAQYEKIAPHVMAKSYDPMQSAALLSALSTTSGERTAEEFDQFTRATIGNIDRTGKPRIKGGIPVGKYFERLGVNKEFLEKTKSTDLPFAIANKISEDVLAKENEAKAQGKEFSREVYLRKQGFANQDDAKALIHYAGLKESGILDKSFLPLAADSAMPTLEQARAPVVKAQRTDPALQGRKSELATQAASIAVGAGKEEFVTNIERVAFANLKARGEVSGEFSEDLQNRWSTDPREILFGHRRKTEMEAQRLLLDEARRVGVKADVPMSVDAKTGERTEKFMGVDKLYELGAKVNAAGGSAVPGLEEVTKRAEKQLEEASKFEGPAAPAPPAPPPAPPPQGPPPQGPPKGPVQAAMGDKPSAFGGIGWRGLVAASAVGALSGGPAVAEFGPRADALPERPSGMPGVSSQRGDDVIGLLKELVRVTKEKGGAATGVISPPVPKPLPPRQPPAGARGRT